MLNFPAGPQGAPVITFPFDTSVIYIKKALTIFPDHGGRKTLCDQYS